MLRPCLESAHVRPAHIAHASQLSNLLRFVSCIRLPDFVTPEKFEWAREEVARKKKADFSAVEFLPVSEGTCVQCMHMGPYDTEPATAEAMHAFAQAQGYTPDISSTRLHHEIYLSDAHKTAPEKLKTVVRHPVREQKAR